MGQIGVPGQLGPEYRASLKLSIRRWISTEKRLYLLTDWLDTFRVVGLTGQSVPVLLLFLGGILFYSLDKLWTEPKYSSCEGTGGPPPVDG